MVSPDQAIDRLRRLALLLAEAEQKERERLAGILHDELQQTLVAARFRALRLAEAEAMSRSAMRSEAGAMSELIDQVLQISRDLSAQLSPPALRSGSLEGMVEWLADWFERKFGLSVTVRAEENLPPVTSTVRLVMYQALRELLLNILKHSGQHGGVIELGHEGKWVTLFVKDSGRGFDPAILRDSLDRSLGLSAIGERLDGIGGRWEIESAPDGRGARFRLWFPIGENVPENAAPDGRPLIRLLIADDHKLVREGLVTLLEEEPDFVVVGEAQTGEEAVALSEELQPDVIIMDVEMPRLNGIEATRRIIERHPDLAVVGLSMHRDKGCAEMMRKAGAAALEDKAKASTQLIETIRRVHGRR